MSGGTGWGSERWGEDVWGSGVAAPIPGPTNTVSLVEVNVWAKDLLELVFTRPMRNDKNLKNIISYSVTPVTVGQTVTVKEVRSGPENFTSRVFLVVSEPEENTEYSVGVDPTLCSVDKIPLSTGVASRVFIGQHTKLDDIVSTRPQNWDTRPNTTFRNILNAIGYQDHLIGGNKK